MKRLCDEPVPAEELAHAKESVAALLLRGLASSESTVDAFTSFVAFGMPLDSYRLIEEATLALKASDIQRAAKRFLHPEALRVVVGDAKTIRPTLEKAGVGAIEMRDEHGAVSADRRRPAPKNPAAMRVVSSRTRNRGSFG